MTTDDDTAWVFTHLIDGDRLPAHPAADWLLASCAVHRTLTDSTRQLLRDLHQLTDAQIELFDGLLPSWSFEAHEAGLADLLDTARALA